MTIQLLHRDKAMNHSCDVGQHNVSNEATEHVDSGFSPRGDTFFAEKCKIFRPFSWQNERNDVFLHNKSKKQMKNIANSFFGFYYYFYFSN